MMEVVTLLYNNMPGLMMMMIIMMMVMVVVQISGHMMILIIMIKLIVMVMVVHMPGLLNHLPSRLPSYPIPPAPQAPASCLIHK